MICGVQDRDNLTMCTVCVGTTVYFFMHAVLILIVLVAFLPLVEEGVGNKERGDVFGQGIDVLL
jgi:hypothetical protein